MDCESGLQRNGPLFEWVVSRRGNAEIVTIRFPDYIKARVTGIEFEIVNGEFSAEAISGNGRLIDGTTALKDDSAESETSSITSGQAISSVIEWHRKVIVSEKFSGATIDDYGVVLNLFVKWIERQGVKFVEEISRKHLYEYRRDVLDRGCSEWTVEHYISKVRALFKRAFSQGVISKYPFDGYKGLARPESKPRSILTLAEMKEISNNLPDTLRTIWDIQRFSGMRLADVLRIQSEDVDYNKRTVTVVMFKRKRRLITLPFRVEVARILAAYRGRKGPLFDFTRAYSEHTIGKIFGNRIIELKGKEFHKPGSHTPRHSFGAFLRESGVKWEDIQFLLGHKILGVTDRYTHDTVERLIGILDTLNFDGAN